MRYLDPKNDLTFKKVFGENPDLLISFLNALMPFDDGQFIESLEYLSPELVPITPGVKNSIVDVRCIDNSGRQFIIEMQMHWTDSFKVRVLLNASKAYVSQLERGKEFKSMCPVYSLNLVNDNYLPDETDFYHHYRIVNIENSEDRIEGLEFVFIELPKFKPETIAEKRMAVLWLRFLTEFDNENPAIKESPENDKIRKAIEILEESSYTKDELEAYDRYWDAVRVEKAIKSDSIEKGIRQGRVEGRKEGREEGRKEGLEKGMTESKINIAKTMIISGYNDDEISRLTGLSIEDILEIKNEKDK